VIRGKSFIPGTSAAFSEGVTIFVAYSHKDTRLRERLSKHLSVLEREGLVRVWFDGCLVPGSAWDETIRHSLDEAGIVLLLISADFVASEYCYSVEMKAALDRHREGQAVVIPVILRDADWTRLPIAELQALPEGARPITKWSDRDSAYKSVVQGVRKAIAALTSSNVSQAKKRRPRIDLLAQRPTIGR
jgi:hypothetical protein